MNDCVFCNIVRKVTPAQIVFESEQYLAFLDKNPRSRGHLQLIPKVHYTWVYEIPDIGSFFVTAKQIIHAIIPALGADHVTIATFGHEIAHAHLWIVPQYTRTGHSVREGQVSKYSKEKANLTEMLRMAISKEVSL